jgi:hypothetical protein
MPRRFQFSLSRLFGATALFAIALGMLRMIYHDGNGFAVTAFPVVAGSALGALFGRTGHGAVAGWCCLPLWWLVLVFVLSFRE